VAALAEVEEGLAREMRLPTVKGSMMMSALRKKTSP
jgi:hypothetical protein